MSRRELVAGAGAVGLGLLAGCGRLPLPDRGQQPPRHTRIGTLGPTSRTTYWDGFDQGLRERGYIDGQNIAIEYRWAEGRTERLASLASELVALPVDVIVAVSPGNRAALDATSSIPIVSVGGDPLRSGLIDSLARPGGNLTGMSEFAPSMAGKQLDLLKTTISTLTHVVVLEDSTQLKTPGSDDELADAAKALGVELEFLTLREPDDLPAVFEAANRNRADALLTRPGPSTIAHRARIAELAVQRGLPMMADRRLFAEAGALMAYGANILDGFRRAAYYVDRILKGAKPADLPVEQPMTFEFVVNLKTAQALGITFPNEIMLQVTEVIQ